MGQIRPAVIFYGRPIHSMNVDVDLEDGVESGVIYADASPTRQITHIYIRIYGVHSVFPIRADTTGKRFGRDEAIYFSVSAEPTIFETRRDALRWYKPAIKRPHGHVGIEGA